MYRVIFLLIFLFTYSNAFTQIEEGDLTLMGGYKTSLKSSPFNNHVVSFDVEYAVLDKVGLNYSIHFANDHVHFPAGILVGILILGYAPDVAEVAYSVLIPEGASFNIPLFRGLYLSPFFNPLGIEYYWDDISDREISFIGTTGIKLKAFIGDGVVLTPYVEARQDFLTPDDWDAKAGFSFGVQF